MVMVRRLNKNLNIFFILVPPKISKKIIYYFIYTILWFKSRISFIFTPEKTLHLKNVLFNR